jgi:hypothetical protein
MTLATFQYQALNYDTNTPIPGANVSIYAGSSNTLDIIYSAADGSVINNPMVADSNGFVNFQGQPLDTLIVSAGPYVSPRLLLQNVGTQGSSSSQIQGQLSSLTELVNQVQAANTSLFNTVQEDVSTINTQLQQNQDQINANNTAANQAYSQLNLLVTNTIQPAVNSANSQLNTILTTTIPAINSYAQNTAASVTTEAGARATADTALAGQLNTLTASVGNSNLLQWSSDLTQPPWTPENVTLTTTGTSPFGGNTCFALIAPINSTASYHYLSQGPISTTLATGQLVTFSAYAQPSTCTQIALQSFDGVTAQAAYFDLTAGTMLTQSGYAGSITPLSNGWFRVSFTIHMAATAAPYFSLFLVQNNSALFSLTSATGLYVYAPQVTSTTGPVPYVGTQAAALNPNSIASLTTGQTLLSTEYSALSSEYSALVAQVGNYSSASLTAQQVAYATTAISTASYITTLQSQYQSLNNTVGQNQTSNTAGIQNALTVATSAASAIAGLSTNIQVAFNSINYVVQSTNLNISPWIYSGLSAVNANGNAPDLGNCWHILEDSTTTDHGLIQIVPTSLLAGETINGSFYVFPGQRNQCTLYLWDGQAYQSATFFLSGSGSVLSNSSLVSQTSIVLVTESWYRISITINMAVAGQTQIALHTAAGGTDYLAGTTGYGLYACWPQVSPTVNPLAYLPTTTAALVNQPTYQNSSAFLSFEQVVRASADQSLSSQITTLQANLNNASTSFTSQQVALVNSQIASSSSVTSLQSQITTNYNNLQGQITTNLSTLSNAQITLVGQTFATSSSVTALNSKVDQNSATLTSSQITLVNQAISTSSIIQNLTSEYAQQQSTIQQNALTASDKTSAVAANLSTLSAAFDSTNYLLESQDFNLSPWGLTGATLGSSNGAPDNGACFLLEEDSSTGVHDIHQLTTQVFQPSEFVNISVYVFPNQRTQVRLYGYNGSAFVYTDFDVSAGTVIDQNGTINAYCSPVVRSWCRISMTVQINPAAAASAMWFYLRLLNGGAESYAGTAGCGVFIWGAQVVPDLTYPTLYIRTGNAAQVNQASLTNTGAFLAQEQAIRASADQAISTQITTVDTRLNGHDASLQTLQSSLNGVEVLYSVTGTIDGVTGGFKFGGVRQNNGTVAYLTEFDSNVTINGNLLVNGTVNTAQITSNAISQCVFAYGLGTVSATVYLTVGDSVFVQFGYYGGDRAPGGGIPNYFVGRVNGSDLLELLLYSVYDTSTSSETINNPAAGSNIYTCPASGSYSFSSTIFYGSSASATIANGAVTVSIIRLSR